jgi:hypothetical protein
VAVWPDPESVQMGFAFGHTQYENPAALTYESLTLDSEDQPGPVLGTVRYQRGRVGDSPETAPTRIDTALRNETGEFTPENATSDRFGTLREGTPMRLAVTLDEDDGPLPVATAHALGFAPIWDGPSINERVPVTGLGPLNRIGRDVEIRSAIRSAALSSSSVIAVPVGYWPMEDGGLSLRLGSKIPGGLDATFSSLELASDATLPGSSALPVFNSASVITAPVTAAVFGNGWTSVWWVKFDAAPASMTTLMQIHVSGSSVKRWVLAADATTIYLSGLDSAGTALYSASSATDHSLWFGGNWLGISIRATVTASSQVFVDARPLDDTSTYTSVFTAGDPALVAGAVDQMHIPASAQIDGMATGHWIVYNESSPPAFVSGANAPAGWAGESARTRVERLAQQSGIEADLASGLSAQVGAWFPGTLYRLMRDAEDADDAVLPERRDGRIGFDPTAIRYNVDDPWPLAFDDQVTDLLGAPLERDTYNLITVSQPGGAFAVAEDTDGPLGTDTTTGIGPRPYPTTLNLHDPDDLAHHAGWLLRKGTIGKRRYLVRLDLHANPDLAVEYMASDPLGRRLVITGVPSGQAGHDDLDLIVEGETGEIGADRWRVLLHCSPYEPWAVMELAEESTPDLNPFMARYATEPGCALRAAIDDNDTTVLVDGNNQRLTVDSADWNLSNHAPLLVVVGGEHMRVDGNASTAAASTGAAGATSVADNAAVTPADYTGGAAQDWALVVARVRDPSVSLAITDPNYTYQLLGAVAGLRLWATVRGADTPAPTITPTGGGAGDVLSAATFGLENMPITLADLTDAILDIRTLTNATAQNITFRRLPSQRTRYGRVILLIAGKSDDSTGIAVPAGFTELIDASTGTGDDQTLYVAYRIDTDPAKVDRGALVVSGGATAVSESMVIALPGGYQTLTVARSQNADPVVKSHAAGDKLAIYRPGIWAL